MSHDGKLRIEHVLRKYEIRKSTQKVNHFNFNFVVLKYNRKETEKNCLEIKMLNLNLQFFFGRAYGNITH